MGAHHELREGFTRRQALRRSSVVGAGAVVATASGVGTSAAETTGAAVTTSPGATPGNYCDDIDSFGYDNGPNLAIGSALPNLQPGAHGNHAFGIGGRPGVPAYGPLGSLTTGYDDTAIGAGTLVSCTMGYSNTAVGADAASGLTTANSCTAIGAQALESLTGSGGAWVGSTAVGQASQQKATGTPNDSLGAQSLATLTTGRYNVALGFQALAAQTIASGNTGVGYRAGANAAGPGITAIGYQAALGPASGYNGSRHTAVGYQALTDIATGNGNTAIGYRAGVAITTGAGNSLVGTSAGANIVTADGNTILGDRAGNRQTTDTENMTLIGRETAGTGAGAVAIGIDSGGTPATAGRDEFVLGTANHQVKISNNAIGSRSAALGSNCPAKRVTEPYTWFRMISSDGSTVYVPCWK